MPDEAVSCTVCGAPLTASQPQQPYQQQPYQQQPYQQQPYQQRPYQQQPYQQRPMGNQNAKNKAIIALCLGIGGLFISFFSGSSWGITGFLGLGLSITGIIFGVKARNELPVGSSDRTLATAGMVCAIIGTVFSALFTLCSLCALCSFGCMACAGETASGYDLGNLEDLGDLADYLTIIFR